MRFVLKSLRLKSKYPKKVIYYPPSKAQSTLSKCRMSDDVYSEVNGTDAKYLGKRKKTVSIRFGPF